MIGGRWGGSAAGDGGARAPGAQAVSVSCGQVLFTYSGGGRRGGKEGRVGEVGGWPWRGCSRCLRAWNTRPTWDRCSGLRLVGPAVACIGLSGEDWWRIGFMYTGAGRPIGSARCRPRRVGHPPYPGTRPIMHANFSCRRTRYLQGCASRWIPRQEPQESARHQTRSFPRPGIEILQNQKFHL